MIRPPRSRPRETHVARQFLGKPRVGVSEVLLEANEGIDDRLRLERSIASADGDLANDAALLESSHRLVGGLVRPLDQGRGSADCEDWRTGQDIKEERDGRARSHPSESRPPLLLDLADAFLEREAFVDGRTTSSCKDADPVIDTLVCRSGIGPAPIAGGPQPTDIRLRLRGEDEGNGGKHSRCQSSSTKDDVDERAPCSPVPVDKRVDGLELSMGYRGLHDGRKGVVRREH